MKIIIVGSVRAASEHRIRGHAALGSPDFSGGNPQVTHVTQCCIHVLQHCIHICDMLHSHVSPAACHATGHTCECNVNA